jgi:hypothetical protein
VRGAEHTQDVPGLSKDSWPVLGAEHTQEVPGLSKDSWPVRGAEHTQDVPGLSKDIWPVRGAEHTLPPRTEVAIASDLHLCIPSVSALACHGVTFTLTV